MKRSRTRKVRPTTTRSSSVDDSSTITDTDDQSDGTYETDLTETEDTLTLEELYEDPLDGTGVDLSEIPEDFDKSPLTTERRERIETRWIRSVVLVEQHRCLRPLTKA
ncbi:hypothetical protein AbraIFM66951_010784 [Aspergillus brasiliensis]|uniref:Uncharacterized protein n=1 Tax=Aspergillus brasiliensis TaxID=319629 RepID=A0A9W5Z1S5_9EURO|nr:hypothetical protein AbraCBS73388_005448 [Aspergillus brasiliensis]GKZ47418.1 hypothetical protein AbraIFM66951_010784 [Aspergillus brasiliensis]